MKDAEKKIGKTVMSCLIERLNEYARAGVLVTPYSDAASLYDSEECKKQLSRRAYTFSSDVPVVGRRYRKNRFTGGCTAVCVWHEDDDGQWLFTDEERFGLATRPSDGEWRLHGWRSRGEFRLHDECIKAAGEADLIAAEEIK